MIETGALAGTDSRTLELLRGEVVYVKPAGARHEDVICELTFWACANEKKISTPVRFGVKDAIEFSAQDSVVTPDLCFLAEQSDMTSRPTSADVLLLVEVADSSLAYDTRDKCSLYADAKVPEYWVIDIESRAMIVHLDPDDGKYSSVRTYREKDEVSPARLEGASLTIGTLLRKDL